MIKLIHDGPISISEGKSRKETLWKNRRISWSEMVGWLSRTVYTSETMEEYKNLPKNEQDDIKDVGGFVGGVLREGKRKKDRVVSRSVLTLDADFAVEGFWNIVDNALDFACCIYSTHKHSKDKPRFRLVIPLSKEVNPEEYEAVARKIASQIGLEYFDATTYEPSRLMYWPSTSKDGCFEFQFKDAVWLRPEEVLNSYENWKDTSLWPEPASVVKHIKRLADKQGNPREKKGSIGAFCRTYTVPEAIDKFLNGIYVSTADKNRYTYAKGSTTGGLVIYEQGDFAYCHHSTDPVQGRLCNAFDLVRLHKFGELDEAAEENTPSVKLPSYAAMMDFISRDEGVKVTLGKERLKLAQEEFQMAEDEEPDMEWLRLLETDKTGRCRPTITNILLILENDPYLKGKIALNEFSHMTMIRGNLPWHQLENQKEGDVYSDWDDAGMRHYMEKYYEINSPNKIYDAVSIVEKKNKYHPIREYLNSLVWDGQPRVDTLLIDYLGAEDSEYVRTVTRKSLAAAVARVFEPGIKFDYMLVLVGKQGLGKSHIIRLLGQSWFSDSFSTVQGKEAYEQLDNAWLIEMAELSAARKAEAEAVKHFISKCDDSYRVAYGRRVTKFPRQCVFFGTTNDNEFLRDKTGNRRFWPVVAGSCERKKDLWTDMNQAEIDQIWAEAMEIWKSGEKIFLESDIEKQALQVQEKHTEESTKEGMIREYVERLLPLGWGGMDIAARRNYIHGWDFGQPVEGTIPRDRVCAMEVWVELLQGEPKAMTPAQAREINEILQKLEGWERYANGSGKLYFGKVYGYQRPFVRMSKMAA